jgi:hypothetical protein
LGQAAWANGTTTDLGKTTEISAQRRLARLSMALGINAFGCQWATKFYLLSCGLFNNLSSNTLIHLPKYNIIGIAEQDSILPLLHSLL